MTDQWLAQLALFLGLDQKAIGQVAAGKRAQTGRVDVAMIQSLVRKDSVTDLVAAYRRFVRLAQGGRAR